jgi:hypothetical protein
MAAVKERPILFQGAMVRALLASTKTQTRRVVKPQPGEDIAGPIHCEVFSPMSHDASATKSPGLTSSARCPYGQPGDRLWVRETWMPDAPRNGEWSDTAFYGCGMSPLSDIPECYRKPWHCLHRATYEGCELVGWKPSIHMPRWASRILLEVTAVRVERLQAISEADAWAEGCARGLPDDVGGFFPAEEPIRGGARGWDCARDWYADLWESINGEGSWDENPWVWVVEFKRTEAR